MITTTQRLLHYTEKPIYMQRILALKGDRAEKKRKKVRPASRVELAKAIRQRQAYEESITACRVLRPDWMIEHSHHNGFTILIEEPTRAVILCCGEHPEAREKIPGDVVEKYALAQLRGR